MTNAGRQAEPGRWQVAAAAAAWVLPGLGHIIIGERVRGAILMITLVGLYTAGLLIGGIDVIDRREDRLWFAGQALAGPVTLLIDRYHQDRKVNPGHGYLTAPRPSDEARAYDVSVGRVNEIGTLYCALAGLLNLLAIVDVLYRIDRGAADAVAELSSGGGGERGRVVVREGAS